MQSTLVLIQIISLPINTCFDEPTFLISFLIKKQIVIYNEINLKIPFKLKVLRKMTSAAQDLRRSKKSALMNSSREIQKKSSLFCLFARLKLFFSMKRKGLVVLSYVASNRFRDMHTSFHDFQVLRINCFNHT